MLYNDFTAQFSAAKRKGSMKPIFLKMTHVATYQRGEEFETLYIQHDGKKSDLELLLAEAKQYNPFENGQKLKKGDKIEIEILGHAGGKDIIRETI